MNRWDSEWSASRVAASVGDCGQAGVCNREHISSVGIFDVGRGEDLHGSSESRLHVQPGGVCFVSVQGCYLAP